MLESPEASLTPYNAPLLRRIALKYIIGGGQAATLCTNDDRSGQDILQMTCLGGFLDLGDLGDDARRDPSGADEDILYSLDRIVGYSVYR